MIACKYILQIVILLAWEAFKALKTTSSTVQGFQVLCHISLEPNNRPHARNNHKNNKATCPQLHEITDRKP